jgi:hypothetical protein
LVPPQIKDVARDVAHVRSAWIWQVLPSRYQLERDTQEIYIHIINLIITILRIITIIMTTTILILTTSTNNTKHMNINHNNNDTHNKNNHMNKNTNKNHTQYY